jgi:homoserine dehydrogenase
VKPVKIGLLGLGTVGTGVVKIVEEHQEDLQRQVGCPVVIEKIAVANLDKPRSVKVDPDKLTDNPEDVLNDPEIDVIVEVIGGTGTARDMIMAALERGKHVVTANKDLMALHGQEVLRKAAEKGCDVFYEASVAGGVPILRTLVDGFSSDRIYKIMGIVNGTTNYILSKMSQNGAAYVDVLREAQELGYAEADPTNDVGGFDAAYKMAILATLGFHAKINFRDVSVKGITGVGIEDIQYAKRLGYEMKLLGIAENKNGHVHVAVEPTLVSKGHPLAAVSGVFNAIYVYGEAVGETMFYGRGAGEMPTATSVVADIVAVVKNLKLGTNGRRSQMSYREVEPLPADRVYARYFMLLRVEDKAGVLARITQVFGEHGVSLESVVQQPTVGHSDAEIVIITHQASKASIDRVLAEFESIEPVRAVKSVYRVEG